MTPRTRNLKYMGTETIDSKLLADAAEWRLLSLLFDCPNADWFAQVEALGREVRDPVDARYPSAYAFNDTGGACFRPLGHRFDGEGGVDDAPVARRMQLEFDRVWERSRICSEYRAL